ncbi:MAG: thrombospondin type 3 repeat-containing protein, partial [Gammaproteobacteria bacterium]
LEDDTDCDGVPNSTDNCPLVSNADQSDFDLDGAGDQCDTDGDDDTIADTADHCPRTSPGDAVDPDGCSRQQRLDANCPSKGACRNHGKYVKCFVKETRAQKSRGLITKKQKKVIVSTAAKSKIGKKKWFLGTADRNDMGKSSKYPIAPTAGHSRFPVRE